MDLKALVDERIQKFIETVNSIKLVFQGMESRAMKAIDDYKFKRLPLVNAQAIVIVTEYYIREARRIIKDALKGLREMREEGPMWQTVRKYAVQCYKYLGTRLKYFSRFTYAFEDTMLNRILL